MKTFRIAVLPGDGIGVEVVEQALEVLRALESHLDSVHFELTEYPAGAAEYLRNGDPLPERTFAAARDSDAVLLGAMGLPSVRWPDGKEMTPQIDLREQLQLYCGLRPIYLYHEQDTPLKGLRRGDIDFVIVRESTEGLFSARMSRADDDEARECSEVCDVMRITRAGSERVCRAAFRLAEKRRKQVALVDKANVLPSMVFFRSIFDNVGQEFPAVTTSRIYVDAAALYLVQRPQSFDVLVTENMFGDILSDLAAGLVGGMGMAPSADIGDECAVFQPSHGSAPDIAGRGIANPVATILSAALMLDWLEHPETKRGAALIRAATEQVLANPANRTADLGGTLTTSQMGARIIDAVKQSARSSA
jgi:3-isopropylmalate dehydrogenase